MARSRTGPETIQLRVTSPPSAQERTVRLASVPIVPWVAAAALGGAASALLGWLLIVGVAGVAWFTASAIPLPEVLAFCSGIWLLAHGGAAEIAGSPVTLMPLGLTLAGAALTRAVGRFAAGQAWLARPGAQRVTDRLALAAQVAGLVAAGYLVVAVAFGMSVGGGWQGLAAPAGGALAIAAVAGFSGALRGLGLRLRQLLPGWLTDGLRGGLAGFLALLGLGAMVVALAMLFGAERVATIEHGLKLDGAGGFVWAMIALAYLPTVLMWALAWALGGGITVGTGSLVTISGTKLGMLPAIPLLGGLPPTGLTPDATIAWLAGGVVAGVLAGAVAAGGPRPGRRLVAAGRAALVALIAGLLTTGLLLGAAAASIGSLGALRLVDLGPRLVELTLIAGPMILLSAVFGGLGRWLVGMLRTRRAASVS